MNLHNEESMRVPPEAKNILNKLESNARNCERILGLSFLGSFARGEASFYSDIDLVALIPDGSDEERPLLELTYGIEITELSRRNSKHVLYVVEEGQKVELTIVKERDLSSVETMFRGSRISDLDNTIIIDKTGALRAKFKDWIVPPDQKPSSVEVNEEARSFLYYYESMNVPLSRGDTYRAFFLYSLMYFKLAATLYAYLGKGDFLYEPAFLITMLKGSDVQLSTRFRKLLPTLSPQDLNEKREEAMNLFVEISTRTPSIDKGIIRMADTLRNFVSAKYPNLWKLRDLGYDRFIRPARVYRSARLTVYSTDVLHRWISKFGLKTIVDLRGDDEVEIEPYESDALSSVIYVRSPVIGKREKNPVIDIQTNQDSVDRKMIMYDTAVDNESLRNALKTVLTLLCDADSIPLLFHCTSGSDRTGIIAATIEGMAGVPKEAILNHYLASSTLLKPEYIMAFLKKVDEIGGYVSFIERSGVSPEIIKCAKKNISRADLSVTIET